MGFINMFDCTTEKRSPDVGFCSTEHMVGDTNGQPHQLKDPNYKSGFNVTLVEQQIIHEAY